MQNITSLVCHGCCWCIVALGVPAAVGAAGFDAGGIGAGSFAAKMMSWSAISSGGGVSSTISWCDRTSWFCNDTSRAGLES